MLSLIRIQIADEIGVKNLKTYIDSKLIVNQVRGDYKVRHKELVPYHNTNIHMVERFRSFQIDHVPRQQNAHVDALASFAASLALPARAAEKVLVYLYCPRFVLEDDQIPIGNLQVKGALGTSAGPELEDLRFPYIDYALYIMLPMTQKRQLPLKESP